MKLELRKLNEPDGKIWFAVYINDSCESPFHPTLEDAQKHYDRIIEQNKKNLPAFEVLSSTEL